MANVDLTVTMLEGMWCIALKEGETVYHLGASSNCDHICALADRLAAQLIAEGHEPVVHHPVMTDRISVGHSSVSLQ